jgi:hypothetical protein
MNTLVALGTSVAYFYSVAVHVLPRLAGAEGLSAHLYYETSAAIVVLVLLGRWFERGRGTDLRGGEEADRAGARDGPGGAGTGAGRHPDRVVWRRATA